MQCRTRAAGDECADQVVACDKRHGDHRDDVERDQAKRQIRQRFLESFPALPLHRHVGIDDAADRTQQGDDLCIQKERRAELARGLDGVRRDRG
jgi:hypothetical protein